MKFVTSTANTKLIRRFEKLVKRGEDLLLEIQVDDDSIQTVTKYTSWKLNCMNALEKLSLHTFSKKFLQIDNNYIDMPSASQVAEFLGVITAVLDEIEDGYIFDLEVLLHAEMFDSITEQAKALLDKGHKIPAAVLARIVIEKWLKDLAREHIEQDIHAEKASIINDKLKSEKIYGTPKWRIIQGHLDVGNSAAHGKDEEFEVQDVKNMLAFIEASCI